MTQQALLAIFFTSLSVHLHRRAHRTKAVEAVAKMEANPPSLSMEQQKIKEWTRSHSGRQQMDPVKAANDRMKMSLLSTGTMILKEKKHS